MIKSVLYFFNKKPTIVALDGVGILKEESNVAKLFELGECYDLDNLLLLSLRKHKPYFIRKWLVGRNMRVNGDPVSYQNIFMILINPHLWSSWPILVVELR